MGFIFSARILARRLLRLSRVPKLRFPGFAVAWEQRKLGDVVQLTGGGTPSKANPSFWNGDIVWLSSQEIKGRFTDHGTYKISQEAVKRSAAKMVQVGTPLIVYRSGILAHSFPITRPTVVVAINQDIKALLFDRSELNTQFVVSQLESKEEYILRNIVKTGTTVQSVNIPDFVRMPFSVPNVDEQSELAEFFASLDDLIALHQRKLSHLIQKCRKRHDTLCLNLEHRPFHKRKPLNERNNHAC